MKQFQLLTASYSTDYLYTYLEGVVEEISSVFFIELARSRDVATPISIQSNDYAYPLKSLIPRGLADKSNCSRFKTVSYPIPKQKKTE